MNAARVISKRDRERTDLISIQSRKASMGEIIGNIAHEWQLFQSGLNRSKRFPSLFSLLNFILMSFQGDAGCLAAGLIGYEKAVLLSEC
jgi:hypothetical protein